MSDIRNQGEGSVGSTLGMIVGLIAGDVGAAIGVIGALWAAFSCMNGAVRVPPDSQWPMYLVSCGTFVALVFACRWRRRS